MAGAAELHPRQFRDALGAFATGVTIVTTLDTEGRPVGVTSSSFNSVSLAPPLVVWSLRLESGSLEAFRRARRFAVHVLEHTQRDLSVQFAGASERRFHGLAWSNSPNLTPDIGRCAARFECRTAHEYLGGDHLIFVGEVVALRATEDSRPLLFHKGRYAEIQA